MLWVRTVSLHQRSLCRRSASSPRLVSSSRRSIHGKTNASEPSRSSSAEVNSVFSAAPSVVAVRGGDDQVPFPNRAYQMVAVSPGPGGWSRLSMPVTNNTWNEPPGPGAARATRTERSRKGEGRSLTTPRLSMMTPMVESISNGDVTGVDADGKTCMYWPRAMIEPAERTAFFTSIDTMHPSGSSSRRDGSAVTEHDWSLEACDRVIAGARTNNAAAVV